MFDRFHPSAPTSTPTDLCLYLSVDLDGGNGDAAAVFPPVLPGGGGLIEFLFLFIYFNFLLSCVFFPSLFPFLFLSFGFYRHTLVFQNL